MATSTSAQETGQSDEEKELAKQAAIAEAKKKIAQAEFDAAKAKKDAAALADPLSEKDKALQEKEIAVAEKEAALAKRELFKGPEVAGNNGKVTATGDYIETRVLARQALALALKETITVLAAKEPFKGAVTLVIYNPADFSAMELYASMLDGLAALEKAFNRANQATQAALELPMDFSTKPAALGSLPLAAFAASGILRTAADIVSLFRTSTDFKNADIVIDESNVVASLVQAISAEKKEWKVFYPALYPVNTIKPLAGATSALLAELDKIQGLARAAEQKTAAAEDQVKVITEALAKETDPAKKANMQERIKAFAPLLAELKSLNAAFAQLQTLLSTTDPVAKLTAQAVLQRAERMVTKLREEKVYVIKMNTVSKGSTKVSENLWRNASVAHSGGTELNVLVFAPDGEVVFSDSRTRYTPYTKPEDIKK